MSYSYLQCYYYQGALIGNNLKVKNAGSKCSSMANKKQAVFYQIQKIFVSL
jgi:hypothetical protein